jgi:hypothetical protein
VKLAKAFQLAHWQAITSEMKQSIEKHRGMAIRQYKAIAVGPCRICRIMVQVTAPEYGSDFRQTHRRAGMTGLCILHGIHCQRAQGGSDRLIQSL